MTSLTTIAPEQQPEIVAAHEEIGRLLGYMSVHRASMTERRREEHYAWITGAYSSATLRGVLALLTIRITQLHRQAVRQIEIPVLVTESSDDLLADLERQRLAFAQRRTWLDHCYEEVELCICVSASARGKHRAIELWAWVTMVDKETAMVAHRIPNGTSYPAASANMFRYRKICRSFPVMPRLTPISLLKSRFRVL